MPYCLAGTYCWAEEWIHWNDSSATECGTKGTDELLDQSDKGHTQNGTLNWVLKEAWN